MPSNASTDYTQLLHAAVQSAREKLIAKHTSAHADAKTAFGAYNIARRNFADLRRGMYDAIARLGVVAYVDRKLVDAHCTAEQNIKLAQYADNKAIAAGQAMTAATASIQSAVNAVEALAYEINGLAAAKPKEEGKWLPTDEAADAAFKKMQPVLESVHRLGAEALKANVEAARPGTAVTVQAAVAVRTKVDALLATADKTLEADGVDAVARAQAERSDALQDLFNKSSDFLTAKLDDTGLEKAAILVDSVNNGALEAESAEIDGAPDTAAISATCSLAVQTPDLDPDVWFFAVRASLAVSFDLDSAYDAVALDKDQFDVKKQKETSENGRRASEGKKESKKGHRSYSATITHDASGAALLFSTAYVVFFLRAAPSERQRRADDLSFASATVITAHPLKFPARPVVLPLHGQAFAVVFSPAADKKYVAAYSVLLVPLELLSLNTDRSPLFGGRETIAASTDVSPNDVCSDASKLTKALRAQYLSDLAATETLEKTIASELDANLKKIGEVAKNSYVVYYNPLARTLVPITKSKPSATDHALFTIGRWADMNGDIHDLGSRTYGAIAQAAHQIRESGDDQADIETPPDVNSPLSGAFPAKGEAEIMPVAST